MIGHLSFMQMLILMFFAHNLADYPLQGDFLAKAKNEKAPIPGVPWQAAMGAHCSIQAGFVYVITGSLVLMFAEYAAHVLIDRAKCRGHIGFATDQLIHLLCKAVWCALFFGLPNMP